MEFLEFLWECVITPIKFILGLIILGIIGSLLGILFAVVTYLFTGKWYPESKEKKKPKYKGQPIVVQGGKESEE